MNELHPTFKRIFEDHGHGSIAQDVTSIIGGRAFASDEMILILRLIDAADHMAGAEIGSPNWEAFCVEFQAAHAKAAPLIAKLVSGERQDATEAEADKAIAILERAIEAARNSNQAGENAVVRAASAIAG